MASVVAYSARSCTAPAADRDLLWPPCPNRQALLPLITKTSNRLLFGFWSAAAVATSLTFQCGRFDIGCASYLRITYEMSVYGWSAPWRTSMINRYRRNSSQKNAPKVYSIRLEQTQCRLFRRKLKVSLVTFLKILLDHIYRASSMESDCHSKVLIVSGVFIQNQLERTTSS